MRPRTPGFIAKSNCLDLGTAEEMSYKNRKKAILEKGASCHVPQLISVCSAEDFSLPINKYITNSSCN